MYIVIGTGAVAAEISMFFQVDGYLEYEYNIEKYYKNYHLEAPILGTVESYKIGDDHFILGMANTPFRNKMIGKIKERGGKFANMIHPLALVHDDFKMGEGNVIYPQCIISTNVKIGDFNLLTCQSILSHDCRLNDNNILATTLLCGHVEAGSDNFFGIRSTVMPDLKIGSRNVVQAGMIVDKDLKSDTTVFYRYKEKLSYERL